MCIVLAYILDSAGQYSGSFKTWAVTIAWAEKNDSQTKRKLWTSTTMPFPTI